MARVLVTEQLADSGLEGLRQAGHEVDARLGLTPAELCEAVKGAHALIVRSATKVTAAVLGAGTGLVVVGRAGIGLDNVDVAEATRRGVMVVNAPNSIMLSTAEHAMALLLAQARNVPQAHADLVAGQWQRKRWQGVELHGKTLGVVGLGRVGSLVAQRASAFGMRLVAYDPYVSADRARQMGIELVPLDELVRRADFVSIHLPRTAETAGMFGDELLGRAKPGLRLVNTSRGGIVDEAALARAIRSGRVAGAALDVFDDEPARDPSPFPPSPVAGLPGVVLTPHLGASTREAQDKAGETIAEQVALALAGQFVPFAVNVDAREAPETVRPFLPLAEHLGQLIASLYGGVPAVLEISYQGELADYDARNLTLAVLQGLFAHCGEPVSYVNAPLLARERGVEVREMMTSTSLDYVNLITLRAGDHAVAGTLAGRSGQPRVVMLDDHAVEVSPANHLLVVRNDDRPGIVGLVGTALGAAGVNIAEMALGRSESGPTALMVITTDQPVPVELTERLAQAPGILGAHAVDQA
ncbi:MAG: phosphoglycerate dehydrogenase [Acidimicrobiales bacterium]